MKVLVTGGCGFIGSNFINYLLSEAGSVQVHNLDKKTYAGRGENLAHMGIKEDERYRFIFGDICDRELVQDVFSEFKPNIVFNFAAESHVDRSIETKTPFVMTNILGTHVLLEAAAENKTDLF